MSELEVPVETKNVTFERYLRDSDVFDDSQLITHYQNKRKSVRYVRKDITAFICQADIFGCYSLFSSSRAIRVKLLDISSRGVLLGGPSKLVLKINQKVMLILIFNSNRKFEISARVMHQLVRGRRFYGVKFDKPNDELGDYLLETQEDLVFK